MRPSPNPPPPLPAAWPYPGRAALPPLRVDRAVVVPGQPGAWELVSDGSVEWGAPFQPLGAAFGRGGVGRAGDVVIRPYRRGGWMRHVNGKTYGNPGRFRAELDLHRALWEAGFPKVRPLGFAWRPHRWGVEGLYLTAFAPGAPWPHAWSEEAWPAVAQAMKALADWGCWSPDLNATNVHVPAAGSPLVLDFDRARFEASADLRRRYAERLARSLEKLGAPESLRHHVAEFR